MLPTIVGKVLMFKCMSCSPCLQTKHGITEQYSSPMRSLYIFNASVEFPKRCLSRFFAKPKLLTVLDLEGATWLNHVPDDLGNLFQLKYLSLRSTNVKSLPKSIGKLQNLETLDLKETLVHDLPSEINKLTKLRHLIACCRRTYGESGMRMKKGVGGMTVLQKLYHVEVM